LCCELRTVNKFQEEGSFIPSSILLKLSVSHFCSQTETNNFVQLRSYIVETYERSESFAAQERGASVGVPIRIVS